MRQLANERLKQSVTALRDVGELIRTRRPSEPVYCLYPHVVRDIAGQFLTGFPGDVLYAVKSNPSLPLLDALYDSGVRHFDTASLQEIRLIKGRFPDARCYFMAPVRILGASAEAYERWGVRDFVLDSDEELEKILAETGARDLTLYVRLKTDVGGAILELSSKFGAHDLDAVRLLKRVAEAGCRPAIAFHVGSLCLDADAFGRALEICRNVLALANVPIVAVDVGGGFPAPYPGNSAPPLSLFFDRIKTAAKTLNLGGKARLLCEPGRGLSAHGMSVVTQIIGHRADQLYMNDGIYGSFAEMLIPNSRITYPLRVMRLEEGRVRLVGGQSRPFITYGPTCDSLDVLPHPTDMPADIQTGDFVEFGLIGAYSYANRTEFNGFFPDEIVEITDSASLPPGISAKA
jgi:ornithine decarboxylase